MIIDTTYLLPLSGISIDVDLLRSVADNKINLNFQEMRVSMISLFEIQAKVAKLKLESKYAIEASEAITATFRVIPFYNSRVIEFSSSLSETLKDYIDCIILGTAISLKEDLITEDSKIRKMGQKVKDSFGINILNYKELRSLRSH